MVSTLNEWTPEQYEFEPRESHLKRNLAIVLICVLVAVVLIASFVLKKWPNVYRNAEMGFEAMHPEEWAVYEEKSEDLLLVRFDSPGEGKIGVFMVQIASQITLADIVSWAKEAYAQSFDNHTILSERSLEVAEAQAHEIVLEVWKNGMHEKRKEVYFIRPGVTWYGATVQYTIWCLAPYEQYDNLNLTFEEFIGSFRFI